VEYCINCIGSQGTYFVNEVANQTWGTTVDYWVSRTNNTAQWCATTAGVQRVCVNNLNNAPVKVMAKSEVHDSSLNPLNTYYSQLKYKSPSNNLWYSFDSQRTIHENFPYDVQILTNTYFHSYRMVPHEVYLPLVIK
jgi:hypothetical protein